MNYKHRKTILITGVSSGIGAALSELCVLQGYRVIGLARSFEKLTLLQQKLGHFFTPIACDVSNRQEIAKISRSLQDQKIHPSTFFLNAGIAGEKAIEDPNNFRVDMHERIMAVNYFGVLAFIES